MMHQGHKRTAGIIIAAAGAMGVLGAAIAIPAGASEPVRDVEFSKQQLNTMTSKLNEVKQSKVPNSVTQWGPSADGDEIVVHALRGEKSAAKDFVQAAGIDEDAVSYKVADERPQLYADVVGGDAYYIDALARCSIGFSVEGGFVSAGHCGSVGSTTTGSDQTTPQGTFEQSIFPENDMSFVATNADWTPTGYVLGEGGTPVEVLGSEEAEVGAEVCRSGSTTGWHCGEIVAKGQTVNYQEGSVYEMTETTVCAEPGDSGGPYISNGQAQGVTSGGSGDCTSGGVTFFQPVNPILENFGLTLVTAAK